MIYFKIDVMEELKKKGYTTYRIRQEKTFGSQTLKEIKEGRVQGMKTLNTICAILGKQPGSIIGFEPREDDLG